MSSNRFNPETESFGDPTPPPQNEAPFVFEGDGDGLFADLARTFLPPTLAPAAPAPFDIDDFVEVARPEPARPDGAWVTYGSYGDNGADIIRAVWGDELSALRHAVENGERVAFLPWGDEL